MNSEVVKLVDISHRYAPNWALANVHFSVEKGSCVAVLGPNGCGKSTLLKILATRLDPTRGSGAILGSDLKRGAFEIRTRVEWLGHELGLYKALTAEENLNFSCLLRGKRPDSLLISKAMTKMGIAKWKGKAVATFSTGMRKRLALARILLHQPQIILLDEPHSNLDREGKQLMNECVHIWKQNGINVFLASHDHLEVLPLCDKALVLNQGRVVYFGDAKRIPTDVIL